MDSIVDGKRPHRNTSAEPIEVLPHTQFSINQRFKVLLFAIHGLGYNKTIHSPATNTRILDAAAKLVAYDEGLTKPPKALTVVKWMDQWKTAAETDGLKYALSRTKPGPNQGDYATRIERENPGYLHRMYRAALKWQGTEAT